MGNRFSNVPDVNIRRSSFNRAHGLKTTFDAGYLVPIYVDEALPGDTFNCKLSAFARLATPVAPIMDNIHMDTFFFAVPMRLIWENWQRFNGEQTNPEDSTDYIIPVLDHTTEPLSSDGGFPVGSLSDYFGLPTGIQGIEGISSMWHRAYNLIWNEWFRDQNLQESVPVPTDDGPDNLNQFELLRRGKRHDYFTSCLPWPQKGPAVELPIGDSAPVLGQPDTAMHFENVPDYGPGIEFRYARTNGDNSGVLDNYRGDITSTGVNFPTDPDDTTVYADLSTATASTINALRQAFQIQRLYERDARGGTRYIEIIKSHFGVTSPDARLQRPEYLGGGRTPINVAPIAQQSETNTTPLGTLGAMGTAASTGHGFRKSFTEHCILIGMTCVTADLTYQQSLDRMFSRSTRWDFYWPSLANIGEQAVLNKEIYCDGSATDDDVFGYQERFAEYRYKPSRITGAFRSTYPTAIDQWHLGIEFGSVPALNDSFIEENPPIDRVIAVPSEPHIIFDSYFDLNTVRPMPVSSVPGLIDHF